MPKNKNVVCQGLSPFRAPSINPIALFPGSRTGQVSKARAIISYLAVKKAGYTQKEVGAILNVSRIAVKNSLQRGEKTLTCVSKYGTK